MSDSWLGSCKFGLDDIVKLRYLPEPNEGKIVELRGPLAPKGVQVYAVQLFWKEGLAGPGEYPEHHLALVQAGPWHPGAVKPQASATE